MKVGDFIRTNGGIGKIINCPEQLKESYGKWLCFETSEEQSPINKEEIIKSSPNIIDLIEVGDYVNGNKIVHIQEEEFPDYPKRLLFAGVDENNIDDVWEVYNKDDIKSIVTKEQFESMEYKVGD